MDDWRNNGGLIWLSFVVAVLEAIGWRLRRRVLSFYGVSNTGCSERPEANGRTRTRRERITCARSEKPRAVVRVPVRGEKQQLEDKKHTVQTAAAHQKSKDFLAEQQLNLEEQERTEEDRRGKRQRLARYRPVRGDWDRIRDLWGEQGLR